MNERVRVLIRAKTDEGMTLKAIAEKAGVAYHVIWYFNAKPNAALNADYAERLLATFGERGEG